MMNQRVGVVCLLLAACARADEVALDARPEAVAPEVSTGEGTASEASEPEGTPAVAGDEMRLLDHLTFGTESFDFYAIDPEGSIALMMQGSATQGELLDALRQGAPADLTYAELWLTLSGEEPGALPSELLADHLQMTTLAGRSGELQRLPMPSVEKALDVNTLFRFRSGVEGCLANSYMERNTRSQFPSFEDRYLCSSSHPDTESFYGTRVGTPFVHDCDAFAIRNNNLNSERLRVSLYLDTQDVNGVSVTEPLTFNGCSGLSASEWQCSSERALNVGNYAVFEMQSAGIGFERLSLNVHNHFSTAPYSVTWGAAMEHFAVPMFQSPFCTGDTPP